MAVTNTHQCTVQASDLIEFNQISAQLDDYTSSGRLPTITSRIDDSANLRITFSYTEQLTVG